MRWCCLGDCSTLWLRRWCRQCSWFSHLPFRNMTHHWSTVSTPLGWMAWCNIFYPCHRRKDGSPDKVCHPLVDLNYTIYSTSKYYLFCGHLISMIHPIQCLPSDLSDFTFILSMWTVVEGANPTTSGTAIFLFLANSSKCFIINTDFIISMTKHRKIPMPISF